MYDTEACILTAHSRFHHSNNNETKKETKKDEITIHEFYV